MTNTDVDTKLQLWEVCSHIWTQKLHGSMPHIQTHAAPLQKYNTDTDTHDHPAPPPLLWPPPTFPVFPSSVWNKTNWLQIQRSLSGWLTQERCREHGETVSVFCVDDLEPLSKYCAAVSHAELRVYLEAEATFKHSRVFTKMNMFPSTFFKNIIVDTRSFKKKKIHLNKPA